MYDYSIECLKTSKTADEPSPRIGGFFSGPVHKHINDDERIHHLVHHYVKSEFNHHLDKILEQTKQVTEKIATVEKLEANLQKLLTQSINNKEQHEHDTLI